MKITEHLENATRPLLSYEIIPPARGASSQATFAIVEQLCKLGPSFIDVTNHSPIAHYEELENDHLRRIYRKKRPGTLGLCTAIQNRFGIDAVPHLLCRGFTREETEDAVIELQFLGIDTVMALRGDETNYYRAGNNGHTVHKYSSGLVKQLSDLRRGQYLDSADNSEPIDLCVGVAAYPEVHVESPNDAYCLKHLKQKIDNGADYIVTQMFFDNRLFFAFVDKCRAAGIEVPIIPGIKVATSKNQITSLPRNFKVSMPEELVDAITASPRQAKKIGVNWTIRQCRELLDHGVPCIHFFVLNDVDVVSRVVEKVY